MVVVESDRLERRAVVGLHVGRAKLHWSTSAADDQDNFGLEPDSRHPAAGSAIAPVKAGVQGSRIGRKGHPVIDDTGAVHFHALVHRETVGGEILDAVGNFQPRRTYLPAVARQIDVRADHARLGQVTLDDDHGGPEAQTGYRAVRRAVAGVGA